MNYQELQKVVRELGKFQVSLWDVKSEDFVGGANTLVSLFALYKDVYKGVPHAEILIFRAIAIDAARAKFSPGLSEQWRAGASAAMDAILDLLLPGHSITGGSQILTPEVFQGLLDSASAAVDQEQEHKKLIGLPEPARGGLN